MTSTRPPLSEKKAKARRVFGNALFEDVNNSLTYSPSPTKASQLDNIEICSAEAVCDGVLEQNFTTTEKENITSNDTTQPKQNGATVRSPVSRDLVKKTQDAINRAAASINQSLGAARIAKETSYRQQTQKTAQVRREWSDDTTEAKKFNVDAEERRRQLLELQRQLSSKYSQERARQTLINRQHRLQRIEEETQFKSEVFRDHQRKLKEERDEQRRKSIAARSRLRSNHRMGEQKLELERIQEEQAIFEERHEASIAIRNTRQEDATARRKSFAFRNGDARRIRELHATIEANRLLKEHESLELKWQGEKDAEEYKRQLENQRRESLAGRNKAARQQREKESARHANQVFETHESYELKWAGEKDAEAYQKSLQEARRRSFAQRNQHAHNQRELKIQEHSDELVEQHESYELKWAGEKDAEAYERRLEAERRESLAQRGVTLRRQREHALQKEAEESEQEHQSFVLKWAGEKDAEAHQKKIERLRRESLASRNKERAQQANVMEELRRLALEKQAESCVLKWTGEKDAEEYLVKMAEERRKSLQLRGQQTLHQRQVEAEQQELELNEAHEDELKRAAVQRDVEAYRKECAERDRMSLEYRRKEARMQRIQEEQQISEQQEVDEQNFELETKARTDVEEYIKDCSRRRRMSLALRAKERRRHIHWERERKRKELNERSRLVNDRLMDQRHVELARQQERARIALDAIRHSSSSFNPFFGALS